MAKIQLIAAICVAAAFLSPALSTSDAVAHEGGGHGRSEGMSIGNFAGGGETRGGRFAGNSVDHRLADGRSDRFNDHHPGRRFGNRFEDDNDCFYPEWQFDCAERAPYADICPD